MKIFTLAFLIFASLFLSTNSFGQITVTDTDVTCFGGSDGTLSITPNNGTAPFTYFWERNTGNPSGGGTILTINTTENINNLPAGTYDVTVVDALGTTTNASTIISAPTPISISITAQTNNLCAGESNGSLTAQASGGTGTLEYSIDGTTFQSSGTFNNLTAQTYILSVRDGNNCIETINFTITEPNTAVGGFVQAQANIACFGESTGSFTVVGNGGLSPYLYSIDNGTTQGLVGTFNNLPAGNYIVNIEDDLGCTFDLPITLTQSTQIIVAATVINNATSPTTANGSAIINANGGTGSYTYLWDDGQTTSTATGLLPGNYCATVTDANNCTNTACVTITSPLAINLSATDDNLSCFGDTDGQSILIISGGIAPYAYGWTNPVTGTNGTGIILIDGGTDTIKNLPAGIYLVGVQDALNETAGDTVFIVEPPQLNVNISSTNVDCFGASNGTATANVSGGFPPYTYNWSNSGTTQTITNLTSGIYYLTVTDFNSCQVFDSIQIAAPAQQLTVLMSKIDISCNGANDGQAFTTMQGGIPPYSYVWSNGDFTANVNNLAPGVIAVSVTDAFGCSVVGNINITQPFALTTTNTAIADATCFGSNNASALTVPNGGTLPYSYLWDNGQTTAFADSLTSGFHTVTVTDANNCTVSENVTLGELPQLTVTTADTTVSCNGVNDGSVVAFPAGGTGPYRYKWNSHPFADTFQVSADLFAGIYLLTVTDANGCIVFGRDTVTQPLPISAISSSTMTSCNDNFTDNGTATLIASGGNGGYTYTWNTTDSTTFIDSLITGWYFVTVTDSIGCLYNDSVFVDAPPPIIIADTSITLVNCFGGSDGTATIVPAGGTPPYDYEWLTTPTQTAPTATGLPIGFYSVLVNDANGCFLDTTRIYVRQPFSPLDAVIGAEAPRCKDGTDGSLNISPAFGGTAGYTYAWSTGDSIFNVFNVPAGNYQVSITDAKGCITIKDTFITNPERFYFNVTVNPVTCFDGSDGQIIIDTAFGGAGAPFAYGFNFGIVQADSSFNNLPPTDLQVTVRDGNGCKIDTVVTIPNAIELFVDAGPDQIIYLGDSTLLQTQVNTTNPLTYLWTPNTALSCDTCDNLIAIPTDNETIYTVMVTDSNGCVAEDEVLITVFQQRKAFIPNAFTPNGDGINDVFVPYGGEGVVGITQLQVYSRWGELLHSTTNFAPSDEAFGWDGTLTGVANAAPGVYVYIVEYEFIDGKKILYTGDVTLIR
jgi:gliding motility-associated-like protein